MTVSELKAKIVEEAKKRDTVILAHTYQNPDIIDIADITGDSFFLSQKAKDLSEKRVVMCGVRFMAESVKILSPETEVILPVPSATCLMAEQISPERVREFKKNNPDTAVVAYINTTAALKAECDVCVTSSSALKIVKALPNKDILFIPDKNLGSYVKKQIPEKNLILWDGFCPVHDKLTKEDIINQFDCEYHRYIQGACAHGGKIYSLEGFGHDKVNVPAIRVINPTAKSQEIFEVFENFDSPTEPELIDFWDGVCYYGDNPGNMYILTEL
jgi:quinolinate synthetase A subunit